MHQQKVFVVAIVAFILSQWAGTIWLASIITSDQITDKDVRMQSALTELGAQLERIEELQFARVATVDSEANTVTLDQSMLQSTLQDIVAGELEKISPALNAEYAQSTQTTAYAGDSPYMSPEDAYVQSQVIIQKAIQYGEWDVKHTAEMVPLVNSLTSEQRIELTEQYMGALERGDIKPTEMAPPL